MRTFSYLPGVTTLTLDAAKCVGCGLCLEVCPHAVLALVEGKARVMERDRCMECGACAMNCPTGALGVEAGVGCAAALIGFALGRKDAACCG